MSHLKVPISDHDHIKGPGDAPITLVEYGDFQCPFCAMAHASLLELEAHFTGKFRLVFRHFPLTGAHEYAQLAALSAESAGLQGKFWEMHDLLYSRQEFINPRGIEEFAKELQLDIDKFASQLSSEMLGQKIKHDFMGGVRSGVNGTPGFFLNGQMYDGPLEVAAFENLLAA